ncbi:hypothetical protein SSX86_005036 [Deinandra increscens subsp. villosa]|uniref:Uncharacterized protein n=1 Tax=Deinandra increscens subsp. villosa TaxID=3103831 RepID=A0AAP0DPQ7_9ASTR
MFRIAVVTGGNKGVGFEICRQLADKSVMVVLTARDEKRGADSVAKLHSSGLPNVVFHQLDVTDPASVASLANFIDARFGKLDILVNNAGISSTIVDKESFWSLDLNLPDQVVGENAKLAKKIVTQTFEGAQKCMETNYYGAKHVTQALLTLLLKSNSPRLVNVSSKLGQLKNVQDESARKIFSDVDGLSEELLDEVVKEYLEDVKDEKLMEKKGWSSNLSGIAVVTGGNKGVGFEICRQLADKSVTVVLTARDEKRGADAVAKLHSSGLPDVVFHHLDVTDPASIASLASFIDARFGKLDILVNNAGISSTIVDEESFWSLNLPAEVIDEKAKQVKKTVKQTFEGAQKCLQTNYYGAKHVTQALLTLLLKSNSPRLVNVSSKLGQLENVQDESKRKILSDVDGFSEELLDEVVKEYLEDVKDEELMEKKGWSSNVSGYIMSKVALNAYTRILAKKLPLLCANAVSPGFVATDMTFFKGTFTAEEGARGPVRLALMPDGGPSGQYFWMLQDSTF